MNGQILVLLATCSFGLLMGLVFDAYRLLTRPCRRRRWLLAFLDFFLWVALACALFALLFVLNKAEVHFYVFFGLALGLLFYYRSLSRYVAGLWPKRPRP